MNTNISNHWAGGAEFEGKTSFLALRAALLYCGITMVWNLISNRLLADWITDPAKFNLWRTYKATDFVALTGIVAFFVLRHQFRRVAGESEARGRRQLEDELRRAEQQQATLINNLDGVVWEADARTHQFTFVSRQVERLLGHPPSQWLAEKTFWQDHLHPEDRDPIVQYCQQQISKGMGYDCEYRMRAADGRIVWLRDRVAVELENGRPVVARGLMVDITQHKKLEDELTLREQRLNAFFNNAPAGLALLDTQLRYVQVNETIAEINGVPLDEHRGKTIHEIMPKLAHAAEPVMRNVLVTGQPRLNLEFSRKTADTPGALRHWTGSLFPVLGRDGQADGIGVIFVEITARLQAEQELRWKTAFLEAQVDSALDGILVVNNRGKAILHNQRMNELWDLPASLAERGSDTEMLQFAARQTRNPDEFIKKVAYLYAHPDEVSRDEIELAKGTILDRYSAPVRDRAGKHFGRIWTFRDITQNRKLEEQLRQAQKMEAIGRLAGGVAHDFNNILAVILLQTGQMLAEGNLTLEQQESAGQIEHAAQRAANLTRQLLMFSRKQPPKMHDLNLNESVFHLARMLQRILGEDIQMEFKYAPGLLLTHADEGMLDQILMNLTINARDAMPEGGRLILQTAAVEFDALAAAQIPRARAGSFVCLSASDTGCGIPPENLLRIFEPFFTTKRAGEGTGLGLATVFGIVQQHQGWITVSSTVGEGTTFQIYLPRLNSATAKGVAPSPPASIRGGTETILLVEDDSALRAATQFALARLGYRVLEAATGDGALAVWNKNPDGIHLILTDLVMPGGMKGTELVERLRQTIPALKVIYTSGYNAEMAGKNLVLEEGVNFLNKPFEARKLAQAVRNCLDKS